MNDLHPLPDDPDADIIEVYLDLGAPDWLLSDVGVYQCAAVEARDARRGTQECLVALEWPTRRNRTEDRQRLRLLIHPRDVRGLCSVLMHTARFIEHVAGETTP